MICCISFIYNVIFSFITKIIDIFSNDKGNIVKNHNFNYTNNVIKIISYNIDNLFVHYDHCKNNLLIKDIEKIFKRKDINVICLQELWNTEYKNKFIKLAIQNKWNYAIPYTHKKYFIGENSGLLFLSKYKILKQDSHIYLNKKGTCSLANKLAQYLKIEINENQRLNITNTHLQSSHLNKYQDFRKTSLKQIDELIDNCPFDNTIIIGDLNLDYDYLKQNLNNKLHFFPNYIKTNTFPETCEHLDHCIYFGKKYNFTMNMKVMNLHNSDHLPILVTLI